MKAPLTGILLSFGLFILCGCPYRPSGNQPQQNEPDNSADRQSVIREIFQPAVEYQPMPPENLEDIYNAQTKWMINFWTWDHSDPPNHMWSAVVYNPSDRKLQGLGTMAYAPSQDYRYDFPTPKTFLDLIDYMGDHPDVFFDHAEFENAPEGKYTTPENADEFFVLSYRPRESSNGFWISKSIVKGDEIPEEIPEEIQHVIDELHKFRDEILQHPCE